MKQFFKKNVRWYHILGMVLGLIFSIYYWYKVGKYSDYILKNNIFLIISFGLSLGYISFDLIMSSLRRLKE